MGYRSVPSRPTVAADTTDRRAADEFHTVQGSGTPLVHRRDEQREPGCRHAISDEIFADDFIDHDGIGRGTTTRQQWQDSVLRPVFGAFTDIDVHVEQLFAEADRVAVRYVFHGTHTGRIRAIPPTQRRIRHTENEIYRIAGGQIAESWGEGDWLGTMRQLGAIPT